MARLAIVTAADPGFFALLVGMVQSLERHPDLARIPLCFFDLAPGGWMPHQRAWLELHMAEIREPGWDYGIREQRGLPAWFRGLAIRPHIPWYFPGYDRFLFLDADVWVQDSCAVETYFEECGKGSLVAAAEIDPCYQVHPGMEDEACRRWHARMVEQFLGAEASRVFYERVRPFNAGVFALRSDAEHWSHWAEGMERAMRRSQGFGVDQAVLLWITWSRRLSLTLLPPRFNWCCHRGMPSWNRQTGRFCTTLPPHDPIGIIHRTGAAKQDPVQTVPDLSGVDVQATLAYPGGLIQDVRTPWTNTVVVT